MTEDRRSHDGEPPTSAVRTRVVDAVNRSGLKQTEIARRIGEDHDWVNNRIRGRTTIAADDLAKFAFALRVDPCVFLRDEPPAEPSAESLAQQRQFRDFIRAYLGLPDPDAEILIDVATTLRRRRFTSPA